MLILSTTFSDVQTFFHTKPSTKFEIPEGLERKWLEIAVASYQLNIGKDLGYDRETGEFKSDLPQIVVNTLAHSMYVSYLERELSRVMALNGIYTKDVNITGQDATKRVTAQELENQRDVLEVLFTRQKDSSFS